MSAEPVGYAVLTLDTRSGVSVVDVASISASLDEAREELAAVRGDSHPGESSMVVALVPLAEGVDW